MNFSNFIAWTHCFNNLQMWTKCTLKQIFKISIHKQNYSKSYTSLKFWLKNILSFWSWGLVCCRFRPPFLWCRISLILWGSSDNKRRFMARNSGKTSPPSCCFFYFSGLNQPCNKKPSKYPALWVRSNSIFIYVLLWINILFDMKYKFPVSTKHGRKTKAQPQFLRHDPFTHSMADQIFMADWLDCILEIHGSGNLT